MDAHRLFGVSGAAAPLGVCVVHRNQRPLQSNPRALCSSLSPSTSFTGGRHDNQVCPRRTYTCWSQQQVMLHWSDAQSRSTAVLFRTSLTVSKEHHLDFHATWMKIDEFPFTLSNTTKCGIISIWMLNLDVSVKCSGFCFSIWCTSNQKDRI